MSKRMFAVSVLVAILLSMLALLLLYFTLKVQWAGAKILGAFWVILYLFIGLWGRKDWFLILISLSSALIISAGLWLMPRGVISENHLFLLTLVLFTLVLVLGRRRILSKTTKIASLLRNIRQEKQS
jgi:peptidoglycan/LPS O-acetylase OafA/YrhL